MRFCRQDILDNRKNVVIKIIFTTLLVVSWALLPKYGFVPLGSEGFDIAGNLLFAFSHANIFHLLVNLLCLWGLRNNLYIIPSLVISFISSLLPEVIFPIYGFSGVLFSIIGIKFGVYGDFIYMSKRLFLFVVIPLFIPNIAGLFHLYCLMFGFVFGWVLGTYRLWMQIQR